MRLRENEALDYLKTNGYHISRMTYYRLKRRVEEKKLQRLYEIAKIGFVHQHIERIDQLELIQHELWKLFELEQEPPQGCNIGKDSQCTTPTYPHIMKLQNM